MDKLNQQWQKLYEAIILDETLNPTQRRQLLDCFLAAKKERDDILEMLKTAKKVIEQFKKLIEKIQKEESNNESHK